MANTTFTGPVVSIGGLIGGPNPNAQATRENDTEQGGSVAFSVTNVTTLTILTGSQSGTTLLATANKGAMVFVNNLTASNISGYAFSNGTTWKQLNAPGTDVVGD
jgi:hypothetical protein